jgi:Spy/CpxP family protein refolding chaperone
MMKNVRSFVSVLALSALATCSLAAVGCGGSVEQPQTQAGAAQKAPVAPQTHGVVKMFGEALGEVALRPDQRTELEKLALAADARHAAMADGKKDLMLAIADQVEKGSIDKTALQPKVDRIVADLEKGRPEDSAALARMHAILDPEQRNAFVDALESKFKGKHHGGRHHGGHNADKGEAGETGKHGGHMGGMHAMKQLSDDLKLTDDQKTQIMDAMKSAHQGHSFKETRERMGQGKRALESFRTDKFDASAAAPSPETLRAQAAIGTSRTIGLAEKVLPILTPDQRKIAAEKLRGMANAGIEVPFGH